MKILYRPQRGGLAEAMAEVKEFATLKEMFKYIVKNWAEAFSIEDLYIRYYGYDSRIDWETYLICTGRIFNENYETPQAIGYCTFVEENNKILLTN